MLRKEPWRGALAPATAIRRTPDSAADRWLRPPAAAAIPHRWRCAAGFRPVAVDVKHALALAATAQVLLAPVGLGEIHGDRVGAGRDRNGVREVAVSLVCEQIRIGRAGDRFKMVGSLAAQIVVVSLPDLPLGIRDGIGLGHNADRVELVRLGGLDLNRADDGLLAPGGETQPENAVRTRLYVLEYPDIGDQGAAGVGNDVKTVDRQLAVHQDVEHTAILSAAGLQAGAVDRLDKMQLHFIGAGFERDVVAGKTDPAILIEERVGCAG